MDLPIYPNVDPKWGGKEELMLLERIEKHGLYSWEIIAKKMKKKRKGKTFSAEEVCQHYQDIYVDGIVGKETWYHGQPTAPIQLSPEFYGDTCAKANLPQDCLNLIGYMPGREEFKNEIDDGAEALINDLKFEDSDTELETKLKLAVLDNYLDVVRDRTVAKSVISSHRLAEQFIDSGESIQRRIRLKGKHPKMELNGDLSWLTSLCGFLPASEFQTFYDDVRKEKKIKKRISETQAKLKKGAKVAKCVEPLELDEKEVPFYLNVGMKDDVVYKSPKKRLKKRRTFYTKKRNYYKY